MGSITFSITQGSPAFSASKTYNISDADLTRFITWAANYYAPSTPQNPNPPPLTNNQACLAWTQDWMRQTVSLQANYEASLAVKALPPITPMVTT